MNRFVKPAVSVALSVAMGISSVQVFAVELKNSIYFSDVSVESYGWATDYVDSIAAKGIASGVGNNMFAPASLLKRGDFAVFLDKTFSFTKSSDTLFYMVDVDPNEYYYQSVVNAKMAGAITDSNNFYPEDYITRIDAMRMIYNALNVQSLIGSNSSTAVSMYADSDEIMNVTDKIVVGTLTNIGVISGSNDGKLHPNDYLTRAEMAVVFAKTSDYVDNKKAEKAAAAEAAKQKEIEDAMATEEEEKDTGTTLVSSGNVTKSMTIDTGKNYDAHDLTIDIADQNKSAISISNDSNVKLRNSSIKTYNYYGISVTDKSTLDLNNVTVNAVNAGALSAGDEAVISAKDFYAVSDSADSIVLGAAKADFENLTVNTSNAAALSMSAGGQVNIDGAALKQSGGKNYSLINIISSPENSTKETQLNISNADINNSTGALFNIRETKVNIVLENCTVDISKLLDVNYSRKNLQEEGNEIYITLINTEIVGDVYVDNKTKLTLDLQDGSSFKGFLDPDMYSENINVKLSADSSLELMGDLYVDTFNIEDYNFNNINDNGFCIYYNDANQDNNELYADTYTLAYGGQLLPR